MPIIGHGDIASVLKEVDRPDFTFFASGVSNSSETREIEFQREIELLLHQDPFKKLVYFGSLSIYYKNTIYTTHKRDIEMIIKENFSDYCIVRLGNITWGKNPNTIINYFKNNRDAYVGVGYRYLVDKEEFLHWMRLIPPFNTELNITGKLISIKEIYDSATTQQNRKLV